MLFFQVFVNFSYWSAMLILPLLLAVGFYKFFAEEISSRTRFVSLFLLFFVEPTLKKIHTNPFFYFIYFIIYLFFYLFLISNYFFRALLGPSSIQKRRRS